MVNIMIMAGGKGTRFWPLSRKKNPKQFLSIINNKPLIEITLERIVDLAPKNNRWILGNQEQSEHLDKLYSYLPKENILKEPFGVMKSPSLVFLPIPFFTKKNLNFFSLKKTCAIFFLEVWTT